MAQRVRIPHRGQGPSSVTQLPILTALHARFPTLFQSIIHQIPIKVNRKFLYVTYFDKILAKIGFYVIMREIHSEMERKL